VQDARDAAEKADLLADAVWMTRKLRLAADAVVGAALSTAVRQARRYENGMVVDNDDEDDLDDRLRTIADDVDLLMRDLADPSLEDRLRATIEDWLRGGGPSRSGRCTGRWSSPRSCAVAASTP
jgi:hypothetical protein